MLNTIKLKLVEVVNYITSLFHKVAPDPVKVIDDIVGDIESKVKALSDAQDSLVCSRAQKHDLMARIAEEINDLEVQSKRAENVKNSMTRILEG